MNLAEPRVRYAVDVLTDLFPGAEVTPDSGRRSPAGPLDRVFALAPGAARPRLIVPTEPRSAAATALRAYGGRMTRAARLSYAGAAGALAVAGPGALRSRLRVTATGEEPVRGIDDHLADAVGRPVAVAFHLTPARANRKPIIQLLAAGERHPVGFAKVGVNELTSRLVAAEAAALATLSRRPHGRMVVPAVSHHGTFAGHEVLTLAALPTWEPGSTPSLAEAAGAASEIAALGPRRVERLADSGYWHGITAQVDRFSAEPRARQLADCIARVTDVAGDAELELTASHGDFSPWNMWLTTRNLLVWDWERFDIATPAGLDLLHFWLNDEFVRGGRRADGLGDRLLASAPEVLTTGGITTPPRLAAMLYLVHLGVRYEVDRQAEAGAGLGKIETWLLPAVASCLADPTLTRRS